MPIGATADQTFFNLGIAVQVTVPAVGRLFTPSLDTLIILDRSATLTGVFWVEQRDVGDVLTADASEPDYLGVRDVAGGFTYVEYENGETELYDLDADPWQELNVAGDPAYAAEEARLAARLRDLADE